MIGLAGRSLNRKIQKTNQKVIRGSYKQLRKVVTLSLE